MVPVPKTTVHENDFAKAWKNQVGMAGKVFPVQAKTIAHGVREAPNDHFRPGVATFDRAHDAASLFGRFLHRRKSILRLGSVSTSSTISL